MAVFFCLIGIVIGRVVVVIEIRAKLPVFFSPTLAVFGPTLALANCALPLVEFSENALEWRLVGSFVPSSRFYFSVNLGRGSKCQCTTDTCYI